MNQLQVYGINLMEVTSTNVALNKRKLDEKPLVIVYNSGKIQNELDENIEQFLEKAKEKQADIWPVAFSKEARKPVDNISKKQSYDIWEQLRCRGLDKIHISAIAKAFSRKIIARELPTLYNNRGEVFISHRRIDGEEIAALIYDKIKIQEEKLKIFRDVTKVNVGDEAQTEIDEVMKDSEIFIFIHTNKAAESDWILKELRFAYSRCMFDFCNRRRTSIKILQWDGSGFWIFMKKLDRNSFHWPDTPDELQKVTLKEMHWLCDGLSLNPQGAFKERHPKIIV